MNSKQRKQAEKLKRDIELTMPLKVQKLHADQEALKKERGELHDWFDAAKLEVGTLQLKAEAELKAKHAESMKKLEEMRQNISARENAVYEQERKLRDEAKKFESVMQEFENGRILADVLLQLELDGTPAEIANSLRIRFGLLIPEW